MKPANSFSPPIPSIAYTASRFPFPISPHVTNLGQRTTVGLIQELLNINNVTGILATEEGDWPEINTDTESYSDEGAEPALRRACHPPCTSPSRAPSDNDTSSDSNNQPRAAGTTHSLCDEA